MDWRDFSPRSEVSPEVHLTRRPKLYPCLGQFHVGHLLYDNSISAGIVRYGYETLCPLVEKVGHYT